MRTMVMETDPFGNFLTQGYEYMSGRDWARLGNLYLQDGVTPGGERILPEGYATFVSTLAPAWVADQRLVYGAFFWINGDGAWPIPKEAYAMNGAGGQSVWMVPFETVAMRFDQIEDAVLGGDADCGVLIHEGRFTYEAKGLTLLADLGSVWEERMHCPLPLAAIAIRRDLAPRLAPIVDAALRASVEYAFAHPEASRDYVAAHAREMDPDVSARHIQLYVNNYTLARDKNAVLRMLEWGRQEGLFPAAAGGLPVFA